MKQMRSRFRLITLVLACAFLLALSLCTGRVLKSAGVTLSSLSSVPVIGTSPSPSPSVSPEDTPESYTPSASPETTPAGSDLPGTDFYTHQEYNVTGL